jgi:hypothetical protein
VTPLPATDLRSNLGTWAVPDCRLPRLAFAMTTALPVEEFDRSFQGQHLFTTYFDTSDFALRKARVNKESYLTIRVRCYEPAGIYAFSAKTEQGKYRREIDSQLAEALLQTGIHSHEWTDLLPADLVARLLDLAGDAPLVPVVCVGFRRYAVEDSQDRLTLDVDIKTDTGKCFPSSVLEYKSTQEDVRFDFAFRPIKLSKFLWSTA